MDALTIARRASAMNDALTALETAMLAVQASDLGKLSPALRRDIETLQAMHDRMSEQLARFVRQPASR